MINPEIGCEEGVLGAAVEMLKQAVSDVVEVAEELLSLGILGTAAMMLEFKLIDVIEGSNTSFVPKARILILDD